MNIYSDITCLKGVGPKTAESLKKCCIFSILDLLLYFPRDYEMISSCNSLTGEKNIGKLIINCKVVKIDKDIRTKNGKQFLLLFLTMAIIYLKENGLTSLT